MSKAVPFTSAMRPAVFRQQKLPPMTGFLIGGGFSLMFWGAAILFFFT